MRYEIRPGKVVEYRLLQKCGRYRVKRRTRYNWLVLPWFWMTDLGAYYRTVRQWTDRDDALNYIDADVALRRCEALGWQEVQR